MIVNYMIKDILPFENLIYNSSLKKDELILRFKNEIETEKAFGFGAYKHAYSKPYIGSIYNNTFEIKRAINYRNSFLPVIKGEINDDLNGSKINIKMSLPLIVKGFMIFWLGGVFLACLGTLFTIIYNDGLNSEGKYFLFIPFAMLIFGLAIVIFGFKVESKKSIKDIERILMEQ